jgi:predicted nuclease of predicted toxin-antitoxin system
MSSPKLRLLLDESITNPLAKGILRMSRSAVYVRTHAKLRGKPDPDIANEANRDDRMIVALDNDYKGIAVKAGVIKLNANRTDEECLIKIFRAFWQSGHRSKAKNRRTYLTNEGIRMTNGEEFLYRWQPHPCSHELSHRY